MAEASFSEPGPLDIAANAMNNVWENNMLVTHILEGLEGPSDLKTSRLICSKWKRFATEILKQRNWTERKFILFKDESAIQKYLDTFSNAKQSITFSCFRVDPLWKCQRYSYWLNRFIQTFPHSIKSLKLIMKFDSPWQLDSILQSQANSLIELETQPCVEEEGDDEPSFGFPMMFFPVPVENYLPSLEYFCMSVVMDATPVNELHQLNIMETILSRIPAENKNTFKICMEACDFIKGTVGVLQKYELVKSLKFLSVVQIWKGELNLLAEAGIKLDLLLIDYPQHYRDVEPDSVTDVEKALWAQGFCEYLRSQRNNLISFRWTNKVFKFPLMGMPRLTTLQLKYYERNETVAYNRGQIPPRLQGTNLIYCDLFPNLQELRIISESEQENQYNPHSIELDFGSMFLAPQLPCTSVQKLQVYYYGMNAQIMSRISTTFPRIKCLDIQLYGTMNEEQQWDFYSALWNAEFKSTIEQLVIHFHKARPLWPELQFNFLGDSLNFATPETCSIYNYTNLKRIELYLDKRCLDRDFLGLKNGLDIFGKIGKLEYLHIDQKLCRFPKSTIQSLKRMLKETPSSTKIFPENLMEKIFECEYMPCYFDNYSASSNLLD